MKKSFVVLALALCAAPALLRAQPIADAQKMVQIFSAATENDTASYLAVVLNDRTIEALFPQSQAKLALRTRARMTTVFFVEGTAKKELDFNPAVSVEQKGQTFNATATPMTKNFVAGKIAKGEKFQGMVELPTKLDLYEPFKLTINKVTLEFRLNEGNVREYGNR